MSTDPSRPEGDERQAALWACIAVLHLAAVGAPIVGDALYEGREEPGLGRFFLHARALEFTHPVTREPVRVTSPLPPELRSVLEKHALAVPPGA